MASVDIASCSHLFQKKTAEIGFVCKIILSISYFFSAFEMNLVIKIMEKSFTDNRIELQQMQS